MLRCSEMQRIYNSQVAGREGAAVAMLWVGAGRGGPGGGRLWRMIAISALWLALSAAPGSARLCPIEALGDGSYVHFGEVALTNRANAGDIANLGFIVGDEGVAVIDTGGSVDIGEACLAALRAITDKPVRYVINTHEHPDHIFGNAAFAGEGTIFVGHLNLAASIAAHGAFYRQSFRDSLGEAALARVRLIAPSLLVEGERALDLGGRVLLLTAWSAAAHSDCDLTVLDMRTRLLFAGDLVFVDHTPIIDGDITGWLALLPRLAGLPATRVLPGHGRRILSWPQGLEDERRYLETVASDARAAIARGVPLAEAVALIGRSERSRWLLFDEYSPRNATSAYSALEWE